jgi:hypothetical protein
MKFSFPREHGAWAMLFAAVALAWAFPGVRGWPAAVLTTLFLIGFAIQQPLRTIVLGHPGKADAFWAVAYATVLLGGAAWLVAACRVYALVPLACAGLVLTTADLVLRRRGRHRNFLVRLVGGACLTLVLPATVAIAHPGEVRYAFAAWGLTLAYFATRFILVRARNEARWRGPSAEAWRSMVPASQAALYAVLLPLAGAGRLNPWLLLAFVPGTIAAVKPSPVESLKATGAREVAHLAWFVVAVVVTFHLR